MLTHVMSHLLNEDLPKVGRDSLSVPLHKRAVIVWLRGDEDFVTGDKISP